MKRNIEHILISTVSLFCTASCNFLQVENIGKSTIDSYFAEITALDPALNGVYNLTYDFIDKYYIAYEEVAGDEIILSPTVSEWQKCQDYALNSSDDATVLGYIWRNGYEVINNANEIIKYAPKLRDEFPDKYVTTDNALAQAYFIRALMHLFLCNVYGQNYTFSADASHLGVINMNHIPSLSEKIVRTSCAEVYAQIISDLNSALATFPAAKSYNSQYMASPAACHALLARVYLYMNDYGNAVKEASLAIAAKDLVAQSSYRAMFTTRVPAADESYLRINGMKQGKSLRSLFYYLEPKARPSARVKDLLQDDDIRKSLFTYKEGQTDIVCKYNCEDDDVVDNIYYSPIILRASEMYLIRAEANCALGHLNEAADDIKALQGRARGIGKDAVSLIYSGKEELDLIIENERIKELCFEGHRFTDIARRHKDVIRTSDSSASVKALTYPDYRFILQIPAVEMEANHDMQQNPTNN